MEVPCQFSAASRQDSGGRDFHTQRLQEVKQDNRSGLFGNQRFTCKPAHAVSSKITSFSCCNSISLLKSVYKALLMYTFDADTTYVSNSNPTTEPLTFSQISRTHTRLAAVLIELLSSPHMQNTSSGSESAQHKTGCIKKSTPVITKAADYRLANDETCTGEVGTSYDNTSSIVPEVIARNLH